jgi:membrane associated rhomboid family serine protease
MAFFQEERSAPAPFLNVPASVLVLIGVMVALHVARLLAPVDIAGPIVSGLVLDPIDYSTQAATFFGLPHAPAIGWQILAPFGHLFLHASWTGLAIDCFWLLAAGSFVARRFGGAGFLALFFLCGLAGTAAFVVSAWGRDIPIVGATSALSGLLAAAIRMIRLQEPWLNQVMLPLQPLVSRQVLGFTAVWLCLNLAMRLLGDGGLGGPGLFVWQDMAGGFLAGLLLAGPFDHIFGLGALLRRRGS